MSITISNLQPGWKKTHGSSSDMMGKDEWLTHTFYESGSWYFHPVLQHKKCSSHQGVLKKNFCIISNMYF